MAVRDWISYEKDMYASEERLSVYILLEIFNLTVKNLIQKPLFRFTDSVVLTVR